MKQLILYLWGRRTTVLGYVVTVLGVLAVSDGIFSTPTLKYIVLANGLLTAILGHYNNAQLKSPPAP